ncbi:MAG: lysylphosphatidylglycerol synthase transmembrane domain-containing protein [Myxococcota bacterium]|nr:lysylphosphatidylglycerol synthase transmembrane domain-containing protein [Myxococcota bacterium]
MKRATGLLLRAAVALAGLAFAFRLALPEGETSVVASLLSAWRVPAGEALLWFGLAVLLLGLNLGIGAIRFRGLLRGAGLHIGLGSLARAYLVASFFNLVLPGAMLGDVYRFWDARRDTGEGSQVLAVVLVERLLSLAALGSIALAVAPVIPSLHEDRQLLVWLVLAGGSFVAIAIGVLLPTVNRVLRRIAQGLARFSPSLSSNGLRALVAVTALASKPLVVSRAFGWSLVNQALPVLALVVLAIPLDAWVPWYWFAVIVPFVTLVSLLPISIGGTGVREVLYVSLFGAVGMPADTALALSLSVLAAALIWGGVGLAVFAAGRGDDPALATTGA